jgi:hypothetical protein
MNIREAIDAIVSHGYPACHSERPSLRVAVDRIFAKESWAGQTVARRIGGMEHP